MTALDQLDRELERRDFGLLKPDTIAQVRDLCRAPGRGGDILYQRLLHGCRVLDQRETDQRWQLFELILNAWRCCQIDRDERKHAAEQAYIERLNTDPETRAMRGRLKARNYRSGQEHERHEQSGLQAPLQLSATGQRQPQLIRRHRKGKQ
jgi:hypothetical protein